MARIKVAGQSAVYHCISRVVGGQALLDDLSKEKLVSLIWKLAGFCGVEVITYCVLSNHFHLLVRVSAQQELSDAQLVERLEGFYGQKAPHWVTLARQELATNGHLASHLRESLLARMGDVSVLIKELKQRFSRWFNRRHERFGTLWAERFKSVLVEDQPRAVATVAAYIDLNPVRAGLVTDPKSYRFCGYAQALAGHRQAQRGLQSFLGQKTWASAAADYRTRLFVGAGKASKSGQAVLAPAAIKQVLAQGGQLSLGQVLRLRLRFFSDGVALGSKGFVEAVFSLHREKFGPKRKNGARPLRGVPLEGLCSLRDLRVAAVT